MKHLFSPLGKRQRARRANRRAGKLRDKGDCPAAIEHYRRAMELDPSFSAPFYNLGLIHKYRAEWQASFEATFRATELSPKDQRSWWNLGIAATALGRWDVARQAWRRAGLEVPEGEGPLDLPCGYNPIRLDPAGAGETVWSQRLDPARARLSKIPLADYCYGDVVLHDGAPVGYRELDGREVPVFNCLGLLEPSQLSTWCVEISLDVGKLVDGGVAPFHELQRLAEARGLAAEDWSRAATDAADAGPHRIAIAAHTRGEVNDLLEDWQPARFGADVGAVQIGFSHA
jgi:hypothetical protein